MNTFIAPVTTALTIILIVAKLIGFVDIEWWQCAIPVLVGIALALAIIIIAFVFAFFGGMWKAYHEYRTRYRTRN